MKDYDTALKFLQRANECEQWIIATAIENGAKERGLNSYTAKLSIEKKLAEYQTATNQAKEMGTTLPNVLKSYRMLNKGSELVPEDLKHAPHHWVTEDHTVREEVMRNGRTTTKYTKVKGVTAPQAARLRRGIQVMLENLFLDLEESDRTDEEKAKYTNDVIESYQTLSYREFTSEVLLALNSSAGVDYDNDEEEQIEQIPMDKEEDLEALVAEMTVHNR